LILADNKIAKSYSGSEQVNVVAMELFIIETLLNGRSVVIPDFGHLELKSLGDRRTVFFKSTDGIDSFLRIMSIVGEEEKKDADILNTLISLPLKEGKIVNLPKIGIFRPVRGEDGKFQVSFMPSSSLRKLLNEDDLISVRKEAHEVRGVKQERVTAPVEKTDVPERKNETLNKRIITNKITDVMGESKKITTTRTLTNNTTVKSASNSIFLKKNSHLNDIIVSQDKQLSGIKLPKERMKILALIAGVIAMIAIVAVAAMFIISRSHRITTTATTTAAATTATVAAANTAKPAEQAAAVAETVVSASPNESYDLPSLAKKYYGHPAFWIYIYEANMDKLTSPINIPKSVSLTIPDLKTEFDVDVNDNMEIQRAKIRTGIILKEKMTEMNNK